MEHTVFILRRDTQGKRSHALIMAAEILLAVLFLWTAGAGAAFPAEPGRSPAQVSNVRFAVSGLRVTVRYDLHGVPNAEYYVSLLLLKKGDPSFSYSPKVLTGDVGMGSYAGRDRSMVWNMSNEFPQGLQGDDFYFVVKAKEVEPAHSTSILAWIGAGAAVVVAAVTYVIVTGHGGPTSPASYPTPPGRP